METVEIKYFLQTAKEKSVRKAAEVIGISPSAISKAIGRLEQELEIKLIEKVGRNLVLTAAGKQLERQGAEFLALERQIVESHNKINDDLIIKIVGPELPLSYWGVKIAKKISESYPKVKVSFKVTTNQEGLDMVNSFDADFALFSSTKTIKRDKSLITKLSDFTLKTFASNQHPIAKKKNVSVKDITLQSFALTNPDAFSLFSEKLQRDGWRDDKFPRKNFIFTDSLKGLDSVLEEGLAISYLPDFYGEKLGLKEINVTGCPYTCSLSVYLCRNKYGLSEIWSLL